MKSKKEEERKEEKKKRKKEEKIKRYGFLWVLWIILDTCIDFYGFVWEKNQTINPFLINLDLKEPYLVYWLCFELELVDCNSQLRNICIKEILGF